MTFLEYIALWSRMQPRVVHRLPGRLRLRIPLLKNMPEEWLNVAAILERIVHGLDGIQGARTDVRTGSFLLEYDGSTIQESDILKFIHNLVKLLQRHHRKIEGMTHGQAVRVAGRLEAWVCNHTRHLSIIDPKLEIPDEIWS